MRSTVIRCGQTLALLLTSLSTAVANPPPVASQVRSCDVANSNERTLLAQAPHGARRQSVHVLEVRTGDGVRRFVDTPPYEPLGGRQWQYCGYDARTKTHLIRMSENGLFSGVLLLDDTGRQINAGHSVLFSPGGEEFLAIEQENGMDGELWSLRRKDGSVKWKGYAGRTTRIDGTESVVSQFERPQWNSKGEVAAIEVCSMGAHSGIVTLVNNGHWNWVGHNCGKPAVKQR